MRDEKGRFVKGYCSSPATQFKKGECNGRTGFKYSEESKEKMRLSRLAYMKKTQPDYLTPEEREALPVEIKVTLTKEWKPRAPVDENGKKIVSEETREKLRQWNTGRKMKPEDIEKMKEAQKLRDHPKYTKEQREALLETYKKKRENGWEKPPHTEETKRKISAVHKGKKLSPETIAKRANYRGENSPLWRGGSRNARMMDMGRIEYKTWRKQVFERDNYTCIKTGVKGGNLHAHHLWSYAKNDDLRYAVYNGVTLSVEAHRDFHKKYGMRDNDSFQFEEWLGFRLPPPIRVNLIDSLEYDMYDLMQSLSDCENDKEYENTLRLTHNLSIAYEESLEINI
jgi:hypothetical protein